VSHRNHIIRPLLMFAGDLCGSVFLDHAFEQYIRGVLGDKVIDNMKVDSILSLAGYVL